jgi:hypothetical protein
MTESVAWKLFQAIIGSILAGLLWWNQNLFEMVQKSNTDRSETIKTIYQDFVRKDDLKEFKDTMNKRFDRMENLLDRDLNHK